MFRIHRAVMAAVATAALMAPAAWAQVKVGAAAPNFTAKDSEGRTQSLSQYRGKYVVLEWTNKDCPYAKAQYDGTMEKLQREWTAKGVVWLTVESSAQGKQGYMTAAEVNEYYKAKHMGSTAVILDADGKLGHMYDAKTTPHMFIIDPSGKLIYDGAIDDHPTTDAADIPHSKNYVSAALTEAMAGQPVETAVTRPYGCSVKYAGE